MKQTTPSNVVAVAFLVCFLLGGVQVNYIYATFAESKYQYEFGLTKTRDIEISATARAISFVGDIMLARDVERKMSTYGSTYPFEQLSKFSLGDVVVANFESSTQKNHTITPNHAMRFATDVNLLHGLFETNITHLSLANNHALDYGEGGFVNTKNALEEGGRVVFGHPYRIDAFSTTYIELEADVVAITAVMAVDGINIVQLGDHLETISTKSDVQVVYIHWGNEYKNFHSPYQKYLAKLMASAGTDLIIGHHPHVVQDIEYIEDTLVLYSLGNFVFDQYFSEEVMIGMVATLKKEEGVLGVALEFSESESVHAQPRPLEMGDQSKLIDFLHNSHTISEDMIAKNFLPLS